MIPKLGFKANVGHLQAEIWGHVEGTTRMMVSCSSRNAWSGKTVVCLGPFVTVDESFEMLKKKAGGDTGDVCEGSYSRKRLLFNSGEKELYLGVVIAQEIIYQHSAFYFLIKTKYLSKNYLF